MNYKTFKLSSVLDIQWGDTSKTKSSYVPTGHLAYSASGPDGFLPTFDYDKEGLVLSAIGANCGVTYLAKGKWSAIKNTICIFAISPEIDLRFFYYYTKDTRFWPKRGSAQPFISKTDIENIEIELPDIKIQREISQKLKSIDDQIHANLEMNETLNSLGQSLFLKSLKSAD